MATSHKRNNTIESLVINGEESSDPVAIRNEIVDFYQILYKETESWRPSLNILDVQTITEEEQILLSRDFEENEVLEGIKQCVVDKAPGPDGYTLAFFPAFWETIKDDVMQTFQHFHAHQKFEKVISKLVNKHQMALIKGSQIMDVALLASESIDSRI